MKAFVDRFEQRESVRRAQVGLRTRERDEAIRRLVAFEQIASAALETEELSLFLDQLLRIFMGAADAADSARIFLRDRDTLVVQASVGLTGDDGAPVALGEGFVGGIAARRLASELVEDARVLYGVPLLHDGEVLGVAHLGSQRARSFPDVEKRLFGALVERASWAVATQLKRSRLHEVLMAAPAMISIVRAPSMVIELANPAFRAVFGERGAVGRHVSETGLDAAAIAVLEEAHVGEKIIAFDELAVHGDFSGSGQQERRWLRFTAQPLRNAAGIVDSVLTFAFDVTPQVEARRSSMRPSVSMGSRCWSSTTRRTRACCCATSSPSAGRR